MRKRLRSPGRIAVGLFARHPNAVDSDDSSGWAIVCMWSKFYRGLSRQDESGGCGLD